MFFITPRRVNSDVPGLASSDLDLKERTAKRRRYNNDQDRDQDQRLHCEEEFNHYRKRIAKACDRCRLKKTKCSGGKFCKRCKQDGTVCVTTTAAKKGDLTKHPEYTHLVESQRDQLARALYHLLQRNGPAGSGDANAFLTEMGIATKSLEVNCHSSSHDEDVNLENISASSSQPWGDLFNNFDASPSAALDSFCATTPQTQGLMYGTPTDPFNPSGLEADGIFDYDGEQFTPLNDELIASYNTSLQPTEADLGI